ncbi:hypothetical protein PpBr36_02401 [Pyricularia pennisetigena]|uniref:hypothetical protein n=1 Tax=Pyricularia pennisetigena TaxID=1578925 RepID=UPI0011529253|nr:hypothetical protein PpBr36_02401 [Pyricularia pennisetigena]TLS30242.1 hypothetical protein PpBr36_02401 [Pyricularia pennisetigena]
MMKQSHEERTAAEPRATFLAGQFLDVFCPGIYKAGGFTVTSAPSRAQRSSSTGPPYLELAVQKSPENPAAAYLWQGRPTSSSNGDSEDDEEDAEETSAGQQHPGIVGTQLQVRIGGSFVYPPSGIASTSQALRRVVFVAGGMGVNPLVSMAAHMAEQDRGDGGPEVRFLYSLRAPGGKGRREGADGMLFLNRLADLFARDYLQGRLQLFLTPATTDDRDDGGEGQSRRTYTDMDGDEVEADGVVSCNEVDVPFHQRRITMSDVVEAVGPEPKQAVVYVCGVPTMTDEMVKYLTDKDAGIGLDTDRVKFEKWW